MLERFHKGHSSLHGVKEKVTRFIDTRLSKVRGEPTGIHDPNWRNYFPFPESFGNPRFHHWAKRLNKGSQTMLLEFINEWELERRGFSMEEIIRSRRNPSTEKPELLKLLEDFLNEEEQREQTGEI